MVSGLRQIILFFLYDDVQQVRDVRFQCSYGRGTHELCCVYVYLVGTFFSLQYTSLRITVKDSPYKYIEVDGQLSTYTFINAFFIFSDSPLFILSQEKEKLYLLSWDMLWIIKLTDFHNPHPFSTGFSQSTPLWKTFIPTQLVLWINNKKRCNYCYFLISYFMFSFLITYPQDKIIHRVLIRCGQNYEQYGITLSTGGGYCRKHKPH